MSGETATRLSFWNAWSAKQALFELAGPVLVIAAIGWVVHLAHLGFGSMFDDANIGATAVGTLAALIAAVFGGYGTSRLVATLRSSVLRGPCPCCAAVRIRKFENPADPKSPPTACEACVAYLRATAGAMSEERPDASDMMARPYMLVSKQYLPGVKSNNRGGFEFEMPAMCSVCGVSDAPHRRDIRNQDATGREESEGLRLVGTLAADAAGVRTVNQKGVHDSGTVASSEDEVMLRRGLIHLKTPVCSKHTESEAPFGDALEFSLEGELAFALYGFYKDFCELNHITRGSAPVTG